MSRWMMPAVCAASSASAIWMPTSSTVSSGSGPAASRSFSVVALQVLHDDERPAVVFADVVDGADVRVVERRCRLRFAGEPAQGLRFAGELVGDELESHEAAQARVLGLVHDAHAAFAELVFDAEGTQPRARFQLDGRSVLEQVRGVLDRGPIEEFGPILLREQQLDFVSQFGVGPLQQHRPLVGGRFTGRMIERLDLAEPRRIHGNCGPFYRFSSRDSHAFARLQSRRTVRGEMSRAATISSSVRPPK